MLKNTTSILTFLLFFNLFNSLAQVVTISDQNGNNNINTPSPQIKINCNYNFIPPKKVKLTATFPDIKNPTEYSVLPINFAPIGLFSAGTPTNITGEDSWSPNIPIGFPFCFYGNTYSTLNVGDNGIVRFGYNSSIPEDGVRTITNTIPSPSLVRNSIFAAFQDYSIIPNNFGCIPGDNCGSITYYTTGVAPFQKMIINYNLINHFGCSNPLSPINTKKSTFQIVLYETSNVIEIYVKDKPITCAGNSDANNGVTNSLIGLTDIYGGSKSIAAPNRNTSVWSATDEAYRFTPNGSSTTVVSWFDYLGNPLGGINPIEVIPTVNTFYTAKVKYNTCTPKEIQSQIDVAFDLNYPVAPNIIKKYCDVALPFPDQSGIDVLALLVDSTDAVGTTKTVYLSQNQADAGPSVANPPILGLNNYTMTTATQVFYYREEIGICYVTGKITLSLFQTPIIADQTINICDAGNDNTETISLSTLTNQVTGFNPATMGIEYYQNQPNAIAGSNTISSVTITKPPGFYDVYIRVFNLQNPLCWNVSIITIKILPNLVLAPITTFCIADSDFDGQVIADFTAISITNLNVPVVNPTFTYYSSLYNAQNNISPITDQTNHPLSIQPAPQFVTIWVVGNLAGYCPAITSVNITICVPTGGGNDGGIGGNGGFGGAGFAACLPANAQIPSFNLEALFNVVILPASPIPTPIGYYRTNLGAQTQNPLVRLTSLEVANFKPTPLFSEIWVRYVDANNVVGIKRLVIPVKFYKTQQVITKQLCDVYGDLKEEINLSPTSSYIQEIQLLNPGETITCYPTQLDYDNGTNTIVFPFKFTLNFGSNPIEDTVYIRVSSYGCDSDYKLVFSLNPFTIKPVIIKNVCDVAPFGNEPYPDLNTIVTNLISSYSVTSTFSIHSDLAGAYNNSNIITNPVNYPVSPTTKVFIRITENPVLFPLACPTIQEIQFGFSDSVLINAVPNIDVCDVDNDGKVPITNLNAIVASIISASNVDPITIKVFTNAPSNLTNDPAYELTGNLDSFIYDSTIVPAITTLFVNLKNTVTGCVRVVPINLTMQSVVLPVLNNPLTICDFKNDNIEKIPDFKIFNSQVVTSSLLYNFQYFLTQADANAGTPVIPANYDLINGSTVWIKITTSANATCSKIKGYNVVFTQCPIITDIKPKICDDLGDNLETKNLNLYQSNIISNPANYTFQYYLSPANANDNSNIQPPSYNMTFGANNLAVPIYVKVIDNVTLCFSIASITFEREPLIEAFDAIISTCDISIDGRLEGVFDLTSIIKRTGTVGMITNPNDFAITYHTDLTATSQNIINTTQITNYNVIGQTSYVFVKFVNKLTSCFTVKQIELQIYQLPKLISGSVFICDDDLDGVYSLNLNDLSSVVIYNPSTLTFGYFNSYDEALANTRPITNLIKYEIPLANFPKSIFVKGTNSNNCSKIREVKIYTKPPVPIKSDNVSLLRCDADNNGLEIFDLTKAETLITNSTGVTFKYFTSFESLQSNSSEITFPTNYPNLVNGQFVFVRLSSPLTNCDNWAKIKLNAFYEQYNFPAQEILCDNNNDGTETKNLEKIVLGYISPLTLAEVKLQFYNLIGDANDGTATGLIPNPLSYTFTNFSTTIFVRLTNILTSCPVVKQINFVKPNPIIISDVSKEICDLDSNNSEKINLSDYFQSMSIPLISSFKITSYLTEADANDENTAISNTNYLQIIPNQVYWVRFQDSNGCFSVKSITIKIIPYAIVSATHPTIELCDNVTSATNSENFKLDTFYPFGVTNIANFNVSYYTNNADALTVSNPLSNDQIQSYTSPTASVWVRIISNIPNSLPACANVFEQKLLVLPYAIVSTTHPTIELCDTGTTTTNSENFKLDTFYPFGVTNIADFNVTYYSNNAEAFTGANAISNDEIQSYTSPTASVWVRIISKIPNSIPACANVFEQKLLVVPIPTPRLNPPIIQLCDDLLSGDLKEIFNLAENETFIRNENSSYIISYFKTKKAAENNETADQITNSGSYFSPTASIWIRITSNTITTLQTCAIVVEQKLQVNPLPLAGPITNLFSCINPFTTQATFDLNLRKSDALAGQNANDFSVTFHLSRENAKDGSSPLPIIYLSNSKNIFASVKNNLTGCRNTSLMQLVAETTTTATQPNERSITFCDDDLINDGSREFDLNVLNIEILGRRQYGISSYQVSYYASENDFINNLPIKSANGFIPSNNALIIANVVNNSSNSVPKCSAKISFNLKIIKLPETNPKNGFVCYDQTTGELLTSYTIDSELSDATHTFEWFLNTNTKPILGETKSTLVVPSVGDYTVIATQKAYPNCKSLPKKITVTKSEPAFATARVEYSFTDNLNVLTIATGLGNYVYQLDNDEIQISNLFENVEPGTHKITVLDKNGCADFVLSVIVLDYIRYFTPNGDNFNDKWNIRGIKDQPDAKVFIFDKYGKLLKQVIPEQDGWDGTYAGQLMPSDDYWFTVSYEENGEQKEFKSHFAMKR